MGIMGVLLTALERSDVVARSVVVGDGHLVSGAVLPFEDDAPLLVNSDAVVARQVALEGFQTVAGRHLQVVEDLGGIHHIELAKRDFLDVLPTPCPGRVDAMEKLRCGVNLLGLAAGLARYGAGSAGLAGW